MGTAIVRPPSIATLKWLMVCLAISTIAWGYYQWASINTSTEPTQPTIDLSNKQKSPDVLDKEISDVANQVKQYKKTQDATFKLLVATFTAVLSLIGLLVAGGYKLMNDLTEMKINVANLKSSSDTQLDSLNTLNISVAKNQTSLEAYTGMIKDIQAMLTNLRNEVLAELKEPRHP